MRIKTLPPDEIFLGLATGSTVLLFLLIIALTIVPALNERRARNGV